MEGTIVLLADFDRIVPSGIESPEESEAGNEFNHLCGDFEQEGIEAEILIIGCEAGNPFAGESIEIDGLADEMQRRIEIAQEMSGMLPEHFDPDNSEPAGAAVVSKNSLDPAGKLKDDTLKNLKSMSANGAVIFAFPDTEAAVKAAIGDGEIQVVEAVEEIAERYHQ